MTGGAVGAAPRLCKEAGCGKPVVGRKMCKLHHQRWLRKHPDMTIQRMNEETVLDAMPGTVLQLIARTGLVRETVNRALAVLNVAGENRRAFIIDHAPPMVKGHKWREIYEQGNGPNKRLTAERKREHTATMKKAGHIRRNGRPTSAMRPVAAWFAPLGLAA